MARKRRQIEVFSLSFLDCICCAFVAIILLFVLSKFGEPLVIEQTRTDLDADSYRQRLDGAVEAHAREAFGQWRRTSFAERAALRAASSLVIIPPRPKALVEPPAARSISGVIDSMTP